MSFLTSEIENCVFCSDDAAGEGALRLVGKSEQVVDFTTAIKSGFANELLMHEYR